MAESAYRVTSSFAVAVRGGMPRVLREGDFVAGNDPIVRTHRAMLQPMSEHIEQATAAPGEARPVTPPSTKERSMPHALPPEHPDSPASPFATAQPGAGVVADDVPAEQNPAGGPKAADAGTITQPPPEPQTPLQAANADTAADTKTKSTKTK